MTAEELYRERCNSPHNIDKHLPIIRHYASMCHHVTEFGVERGWSTSALLASGAKAVRSYDWVRQPEVDFIEAIAKQEGIDFRFIEADTARTRIEPTDLLFVDTDHTYEQVDAELACNIGMVNYFLVFHDTVSFPAIVPAIRKHCDFGWVVRYDTKEQHGLMVLERIPV